MKKKLSALLLTLVFAFTLTSCDQESTISPDNLPNEIDSYISTHFPENTVLQAIKDKEGLKSTYEITLSDNIYLEFDSKMNITDIDGNAKLPDSVIPEKILQYVAFNYPNNYITDWELDDRNQQIQLDNGLDLEFNMNGDFIKID